MGVVIAGLLEVEPFVGDSAETFGIRDCDICSATLADDPPRQWRTFYYDPAERLSVCEHCVEAYLNASVLAAVPAVPRA